MTEWTPPEIIALTSGSAVSVPLQALIDNSSISAGSRATEFHWTLEQSVDGLTLMRPDGVKQRVDFTAGKTRHRTLESGQGAGVLRKALGIAAFCKRQDRFPHVVDATGGWGQDAWAIAATGCTICVIEQHAIIHALLSDGLSRALQDDVGATIATRIQLVNDNAMQVLDKVDGDVIYLDPMYPARTRKKADSKKGMQFLHALLGPSDERLSTELLASALQTAAQRIVVKRPKGAEPLPAPASWSGQKTTIESPNTRYDVYLKR